MNVLIIGRGGREAALARKVYQDDNTNVIYVAPGNDGMAAFATCVAINETDIAGLLDFAKTEAIDFTIVGPEAALEAGIVDAFVAAGLIIWGPTRLAAQIETSKSFTKDLLSKYGIPTADYAVFHEPQAAIAYVHEQQLPIVIKADGLAAGKGVVIADTYDEAETVLQDWLGDNTLGASGNRVVIETFLRGEEFSFMTFVHGTKVYPMPLSQDHKRVYDGDLGPNTGGMGAYAPVPQISEAMRQQTLVTIMEAAAQAMVAEGMPFSGFLYGGIIATDAGPKVIEFNARFGDPEAEVILPLLKTPLIPILQSILAGEQPDIQWYDAFALGVVLASEGYPVAPLIGSSVGHLDELSQVKVYPAAVKLTENGYVSSGGRVVVVTAIADSLLAAQNIVYRELAKLPKTGLFYRRDIGDKAIKK